MNIIEYVKKVKDYSFDVEPFNEVDNVVFSILAYGNYEDILSPNQFNKKTIHRLGNIFFEEHRDTRELNQNIIAIRGGINLLRQVKDSVRYKDVLVYNYTRKITDHEQFCAMTFKYSKNSCYVAFEGTDENLSGWKEDAVMSYKFPVYAHTDAIKYLNTFFSFNFDKLIVGGHSKGGNLALVSSMYASNLVRKKITTIYSNDGQGLLDEQFNSKEYTKIKDKFIHIIPNYSFVGLLLRSERNYRIVKSNKNNLEAHDAMTWEIKDNAFVDSKLSGFSQILDEGFDDWLDHYDNKAREKFIEAIFDIFKQNNITTLIELKKDYKKIFKLIKSSLKVDKEVTDMLKHLIKVLSKADFDYHTEKIIDLTNKI